MSADSKREPQPLRPEEVVNLSRELEAIIAAGVPLDFGLQSTASGFSFKLEAVAVQLASRLEQGATISEALRDEKSIPAVFRAVLIAGVRCGQSEAVLRDISKLSQMLIALRRSLKIGMVYPIFVVFLSLSLLMLVMSALFPQMVQLYQQLNIPLPSWLETMTSIPVGPVSFFGLLGLFALSLYWLWSSGRRSLLSGLYWIPGVRQISKDFSIAHFSHLLAVLVKYGVPLPEALQLSAEAIAGDRFPKEVMDLANLTRQGNNWDDSVERMTTFPPFLKWLLVAGQSDSDLGAAIEEAGNYYEQRARAKAIWLSRVLPTAAVVIIGGGVTFIYGLSVFGPMIDLWSKLAHY